MNKIIYIFTLLFTPGLFAQQPTHVPGPQTNTPIDLNSWFDIIVFIVMPLIMIIFYFMWRRQVKMDKEAEKRDKKS
jgi:heme/copper-type cytochrome/quinol oxidase subunit 2